MLSDVRSYYGFARDFAQAGYFETAHSQQIVRELSYEIRAGKLVTLSGIVGCGKTTTLRRIQEALAQDKEILVSKSLSVEKSQLSLAVLINALFYDLAIEKDFKIPTQPEKRERVLRDLIRKRQKPIALFVDDAHDLQAKTLVGLKRLIEVVRDGNGTLSVVLAGHPKLKNDLRRPTMEEIGSRATIFDLEGFGGEKLPYLRWLLIQCLNTKGKADVTPEERLEAVITDEAMVFLSGKLSTPLQFETYLTRSFEEGYKVAQKPITVDVITSILAKNIDDLEPQLTRHGYNAKVLSEVLNAKPREIRALLRGQLPPGRAQELQHEMLAVGIPI
jgi:type II secretory pathway predicted ATPase ExeA